MLLNLGVLSEGCRLLLLLKLGVLREGSSVCLGRPEALA